MLSFGLFDGNAQGLRAAQEQLGRGSQVECIARHIEAVLLDGAFEVIEAPRP